MSREALLNISIKVMENFADTYLKTWSSYGPYTLNEKTEEYMDFKDCYGTLISFSRPRLEEWTADDGYGRALVALIKDPGMHGSAMWVYTSKELAQLVTYKLADCTGEPTELGKEVYQALFK